MKPLQKKLIVILGPTASGKSDIAVRLAKKIRGEVISADSRQVYKGLDIGSGKIGKKEMRGVPHHLLDVASPKRTFTAAHYQTLGARAINKVFAKKKVPIVAGGTGFYIDALIRNYRLPEIKPNLKLRRTLEKRSAEELFSRLKELDARRAGTIDRNNKRRLVRALEIVLQTGKPVPSLAAGSPYEVLKIGIKIPAEKLEENIKKRLDARIKKGMIGEVRGLRRQGLSWKRLDDLGLEYRYVSRYLRGLASKEEMVRTLEKEIGHYAKRQMTWFKRDKSTLWMNDEKNILKAAKKFLK